MTGARTVRNPDLIPHQLAGAFSALLRRDLTPSQWAEVRVRNLQFDDAPICASHDVCDANMVMFEACRALGVPVVGDMEPGTVAEGEAVAVWNRAWDIAKAEHLTERATMDDLTEELEAFYQREGLESSCALEALMFATLTDSQRDYLTRFNARWDALQDAADLAETVRAHGAA